jgi:hypothetical protein
LIKALQPKEPSVLVDRETGEAFGFEWKTNYTDIAILHPFSNYINGRPDWMFAQGNLAYELILPEHELNYPLMILAFNADEDIQRTVPMDIVEADSTDFSVTMALPKGDYQIMLADSVKAMVYDWKVE